MLLKGCFLLEGNTAPNSNTLKKHDFTSADGTKYVWEERQETSITLTKDEIDNLRDYIKVTSDQVLQNSISGNGQVMGVKIPLSEARLEVFTRFVLDVLLFKERLHIKLTDHATDRLTEDIINGSDHPNFRGWLSEEDVKECVLLVSAVDAGRLTINKSTLGSSEIKFNSVIALEVRGEKPSGEEGTLALAIIEERKIRIITLL